MSHKANTNTDEKGNRQELQSLQFKETDRWKPNKVRKRAFAHNRYKCQWALLVLSKSLLKILSAKVNLRVHKHTRDAFIGHYFHENSSQVYASDGPPPPPPPASSPSAASQTQASVRPLSYHIKGEFRQLLWSTPLRK